MKTIETKKILDKFVLDYLIANQIKITPKRFKLFLYYLQNNPEVVRKEIEEKIDSLLRIASYHFSRYIYCSDAKKASMEILEAYKEYILRRIFKKTH